MPRIGGERVCCCPASGPPARCVLNSCVRLLRRHYMVGINVRRIGLKSCPYCGSSEVFRSQPKTWWERAPVMFLLRLVRCHDCMRHHYRPLLLRIVKHPGKKPAGPNRLGEGKGREAFSLETPRGAVRLPVPLGNLQVGNFL